MRNYNQKSTFYRKDAKNAKFTSFLFSFERKENKSYKSYSNYTILFVCYCFCVSIFFSAFSAEKNIFFANFAS
ncbi:MAG: hypothetical protein C4B58_12675 [Deltaproteobacteria bacterium]|nr:MAG: hypothetical protein C4B58_12675 [Deltaproteobacteria bacterium]